MMNGPRGHDRMLGQTLGHYRIVKKIGAGGMGDVYLAHDDRLDRDVALKVLHAGALTDDAARKRFRKEALVLSRLNHPNIATILDFDTQEGMDFLVMEYVAGKTLEAAGMRPLAGEEVVRLGVQLAEGLAAAHRQQIVHRDLKPGNLRLTRDGRLKILDFGLAKLVREPASGMATTESMTELRGPIGTLPYMAPEQLRGRAVDRRTDVWAFGCILFEWLSGHHAFTGETGTDVIARILEREPNWSVIPAGTPQRLRDLMRRCLAKNRADRPGEIGDLGRELIDATPVSSPPGGRAAAKSESVASSAFRLSADTAPPPSLAVLYFENLSGDPENDYFCAGITEDILTDLSKIKALRVASRNAVARFRDTQVDIPKIASELGVDAILEGSVRRAGDQVRITAQLVSAADGFHLWAERYDRRLQDVFAVQEEIAWSISTALRIAISPAQTKEISLTRPADVRAYDLYLKGRQFYGRYTPESIRYAIELFQQATVMDPSYALAFAGIGDCCGQMLNREDADRREECIRIGLDAARRAVALNPQLPEGHKAEALILRFLGDAEGSRAALVRAIEADPRFTPALLNLALACVDRGNLAAAERLYRRSFDLDPYNAYTMEEYGFLLLLTGRLEESAVWLDRLRRISSDPFYLTSVYANRVVIHLRRGDLEAAERSIREGVAAGVSVHNMNALEAMIAVRSGRTEVARNLVIGLQSVSGLDVTPLMTAAGAALQIGEPGRAVGFLTRSLIRDFAPVLIRLDRQLHPLLDHKPFAPRLLDATLVWPLEAPPLDPVCHELFRNRRVESGAPRGSDILAGV